MKPLLIILSLCCTAPLSAAETEPAAAPASWHVQNAELRAPVKVDVKAALLRMPPQVYLADLTPLEITDGLAFDPLSKDFIRIDVRDPKEKAATIAKLKETYKAAGKEWDPKAYGGTNENDGGPMLRVQGSVTVALKPEYKFFAWQRMSQGKVFIDGKPVKPHRMGTRAWRKGKVGWQDGKIDIHEGVEGIDRLGGHFGHAGLVTIPPGAKTLKFEVAPGGQGPFVRQAGFITRNPKVARATICLPGRDPSKLVPVVVRAGGERVGCRVVWAGKSIPMTIMFDSSSGDEDYWVYLVDQAKKPAPLAWTPQAELIEEARQLDRYNPELETLPGFEKLWGSAVIVGRGVPLSRTVTTYHYSKGMGRLKPSRVIFRGTPSFGKNGTAPFTLHELAGSQPATLSRISGTFHIPASGSYRIFCMSGPGGYVLLDGHLIASLRDGKSGGNHAGEKSGRILDLELEKGQHRIELLQYGPTGQVGWAGLWWKDPGLKDLNGDKIIGFRLFGKTNEVTSGTPGNTSANYMVWEPLADTMTAPLEHRAKDAWATFSWYSLAHQGGVYPGIGYPRYALNWYRFSADALGASADAVYRWRFDDGRTAEGKQVTKLFLRSGIRKVQLEVLDAPGGKVLARTAGEVAVQMSVADWHDGNLVNWSYSGGHFRHSSSPLLAQIWEFAAEGRLERLPVDDLVNYYEWLNNGSIKNGRDQGSLDPATWVRPAEGGSQEEYLSRMKVFDHAVKSQRKARQRSGDVLAGRVDDVIAAYPYSELLRIAQSLSRTERGPSRAHYAAAEKLLATVIDRALAGSSHWSTAALALADIKLSVRGDTESAQALLEKFQQTKPAVDRVDSWQFAEARKAHQLADTDQLAGLTAGLDWSPIERPRHQIGYHREPYQPIRGRTALQEMVGDGWSIPFKNNRGFWLARDFDLPADWKGSQLIFNAGTPQVKNHWQKDQTEYVWINGEPLGRMRQWTDQNMVIPAKLLKKGGKNRITWLIQPYPWSTIGAVASPVLSENLTCNAKVSRGHIHLQKEGHRGKDLGRTQLVGVISDTPRSLAFSPDGKQLVSGHQYGRVRLWDVDKILASKRDPSINTNHSFAYPVSHTFNIGRVAIASLAFSPDGKRLAAGSEDYRIALLDPINGKVLRSFVAHEGDVIALAFSPDGTRLASGSHDLTVKIWDSSSGKKLLTLAGHAEPVDAVAYSPDGKSIATAIDKTHVRLWDANTGKTLRDLEGQQGQVLSLAFSPDGKRLAAGNREGFIMQWDLASGKKLTMVPPRTVYDTAARAVNVMYSRDGKALVSIGGIGGYAQKWDSETGSGGKRFAKLHGSSSHRSVPWLPPGKGDFLQVESPNRPAIGFENFPVELYTTKACEEQGMTVASYDGLWEKLPDFDTLKPVVQGVIRHIDQEHLSGTTWRPELHGRRFVDGRYVLNSIEQEHLSDGLLPYWKISKKKDGSDQRTAHPSGLKATGYLKVEKAGDYTFSLHSHDSSRLVVASKVVIDNDGQKRGEAAEEVKHGTVHLEPGVHPVTLTYLKASHDHNSVRGLHVAFPREFVRSLTVGDIASIRLMAGALLAQGKREEAEVLLTKLHRDGWPLSEEDQEHVEQARMRIRRMARTTSLNDRSHALGLIESSLVTYPMLRLDPEFMVSVIAVYAALGDPRAAILAEQMLEAEMHDGQRRLLIMTQVKVKLNEGDLPGAGQVYRKLKELAPQSEEVIEARELIKAAVIKKRD
ncbi:PA14 domain-containing protein [Verrucomicrobia bacterium]|nr:PA14 domain-containing protein [Verrucomicrobiota bacterium]